MSNTKFNRCLMAAVALMLSLLVSLNISVDPYGVFGTSGLPDGPSSNERFIKIQHTIDENVGYELLLFGSSRSGMTDPAWFEQATGLRSYNLSVFSGRPRDMEKLYAAYKKTHTGPKRVVVGLDAMSFLLEGDDTDLSRRHHPSADDASRISYWLDYLLAPSILPSMEKVTNRKRPTIVFDWAAGTYSLKHYERLIAENHQAYMDEKFGTWTPRQLSAELDAREWEALSRWLAVLQRDNVEITIFLQPMHRQWRARMAPLMKDLEPLLQSVAGLVDLSHLESDNDAVWYEQRHYREPVARSVVDALFGASAQIAIAQRP